MNLFLEKIKEGIGLGIGFFIISIILVGAYAFVEPSNGPSSNYIINWLSPLNQMHNDTNDKVNQVLTDVGDINPGNYSPSNWNCILETSSSWTPTGSGQRADRIVYCPADYNLITGGCDTDYPDDFYIEGNPTDNGWRCSFYFGSGTLGTNYAKAWCCK